MNENFIILEQFLHQVRCCCPGQIHQHMLEFHQGDIWIINQEPMFIDSIGWHLLINFNNEYQFYMHVEDIEKLYNKGNICSILDLDLKINSLSLKVDEALDVRDRKSFFLYTYELKTLKEIKKEIINFSFKILG